MYGSLEPNIDYGYPTNRGYRDVLGHNKPTIHTMYRLKGTTTVISDFTTMRKKPRTNETQAHIKPSSIKRWELTHTNQG